jgi:gamma-glutamylaminecyclotransferase
MSETPSAPARAMLLFVYGTLKRGGANHGWLAGQTFLGPARTAPGFTLYSLGEYPGLVADASDREGVAGELWAVDAACLARLDAFEGVPEKLYAREPARLAELPPGVSPADSSRAQLYRYLRKVDPRARVGSTWPV